MELEEIEEIIVSLSGELPSEVKGPFCFMAGMTMGALENAPPGAVYDFWETILIALILRARELVDGEGGGGGGLPGYGPN
jgi:hypothetical protein